jgi:hypothetical protein
VLIYVCYQKWRSIVSPGQHKVQYLILLEDYLRELPGLIDEATGEKSTLASNCNSDLEHHQDASLEDIKFLKEKAQKLLNETGKVRGIVCLHFHFQSIL